MACTSESRMTPTAKLIGMHRWFLIFLLALLPVQWTWAAVSSYCQHESTPVRQHIGHHVDKHSGAQSDADSASTAEASSVENDCGVCHANCAVALQSALPALNPNSTPRWMDAHSTWHSTQYRDAPDRPRWISLAS
jgi:hypothetical protein